MRPFFAFLPLLIIAFAASAEEPAVVARHGRVAIAGQPDEAAIIAWRTAGASVVVNFRTRGETAALSFDEAGAIEAAGLTYVEIPVGGETGFSPAATAALAEVLAEHDGEVVLHCASGMRAAHVYAAHLMSSGQIARENLGDIGWPRAWADLVLAQLAPEEPPAN